MHATDNRHGDMAHLPLDYLVNRGVVVDISKDMHDWAVITPQVIENAGAEIREGDILICTGWYRHSEGQSQQDLVEDLLPPGPQSRHSALDAEEENQVVGNGLRLVRSRDEYFDSGHEARSC